MIEFLTLFSALVTGVQPVEVRVDPQVDTVELRLDGEAVTSLVGPPWRIAIDLGSDLAPHELEAVARAAGGRELAVARQRINWPAVEGEAEAEERTPVAVASVEVDKPPTAEQLAGALIAEGRSIAPLAITADGGDVVLVRDSPSERALALLADEMIRRLRATSVDYPADMMRLQLPLGASRRVALVWTVAAEAPAERPEAAFDLFAISPFFGHEEGGLSWLLAHAGPPPPPERVADAVCAAGLLAAAAPRPRAVVLVVDPATVDGGLFDPATARRFLARLGVPLAVWTPAADPEEVAAVAARWGDAVSVADLDRLTAAVRRLSATLDRQAIAWLPGHHPPGSVAIAPGAGVVLAGGEAAAGGGER